MIGNKTWSILLSLLLVVAAVTSNVLADGTNTTTPDNFAIEIVEDKQFISSAIGNIGEGKAIFTKLEYQFLSDIENNLGIKFRIEPSNDERKLTWFGIFNHGGNEIPIYVSSTVAIEEIKLKKMARMAIVKYLKKEKDVYYKSSLTVASSIFPDASYTLKDQALNLNVTNNSDGETWWYHEYRVYKGGSNSTLDLFYLRGDQEWLDAADSDYNDHYTTLERYSSEWILQEQNGSEMLDPAPASSGNQFSITITLPPNISWTSDTGGSVDISQDFDLSTDKVIWTATDQLFPGDLYHNLEDFGFTQGAEIESKLSNNGFKMDVYYTTWETYDWGFPPTDNWHDLIYYIDDLEKLRFED